MKFSKIFVFDNTSRLNNIRWVRFGTKFPPTQTDSRISKVPLNQRVSSILFNLYISLILSNRNFSWQLYKWAPHVLNTSGLM